MEPDLTILLDAPAEIGMQRAAARGDGDRMDSQALSFYRRVRDGYLCLAEQHPARFVVIDANRSLEQVRESIGQEMDRFYSANRDQ